MLRDFLLRAISVPHSSSIQDARLRSIRSSLPKARSDLYRDVLCRLKNLGIILLDRKIQALRLVGEKAGESRHSARLMALNAGFRFGTHSEEYRFRSRLLLVPVGRKADRVIVLFLQAFQLFFQFVCNRFVFLLSVKVVHF